MQLGFFTQCFLTDKFLTIHCQMTIFAGLTCNPQIAELSLWANGMWFVKDEVSRHLHHQIAP